MNSFHSFRNFFCNALCFEGRFFSASALFAAGLALSLPALFANSAAARAETASEAVARIAASAESGAPGQNGGQITGPSGLPLPRFVTLKSGKVNMRVGPDMGKYPITWTYERQGLPVEIIQEYGNWRRIRDIDGTEGWVNAALLSGKRGAIIAPHSKGGGQIMLFAKPDAASKVTIKADAGVIGKIRKCDGTWCEMNIQGNYGYIRENQLWGVYGAEVVKD